MRLYYQDKTNQMTAFPDARITDNEGRGNVSIMRVDNGVAFLPSPPPPL